MGDLLERAAALPASWWVCTALSAAGLAVLFATVSILQAWRRS